MPIDTKKAPEKAPSEKSPGIGTLSHFQGTSWAIVLVISMPGRAATGLLFRFAVLFFCIRVESSSIRETRLNFIVSSGEKEFLG